MMIFTTRTEARTVLKTLQRRRRVPVTNGTGFSLYVSLRAVDGFSTAARNIQLARVHVKINKKTKLQIKNIYNNKRK